MAVSLVLAVSAGRQLASQSSDYEHESTWWLGARESVTVAPLDVAVADDGTAYVADADGHQVIIFDPAGAVVDRWVASPSAALCGGAYVPYAIELHQNIGRVYVLWVFHVGGGERAGQAVSAFVEERDLAGRSLRETRVAAVAREMSVNPSTGDVILLYRANLERIRGWGSLAESGLITRVSGNQARAGSLAHLPDGRMVVVKTAGRVDLTSPDGIQLGTLDTRGYTPVAVSTDGAGKVAVLVRSSGGDPQVLVYEDVRAGPAQVLDPASLGLSGIPDTDWPYTLALAGDRLAVAGAGDQFEVGRSGQSPIQGATALPAIAQTAESDLYACGGVPVLTQAGDGYVAIVADGEGSEMLLIESAGRRTLLGRVPERVVDAAVLEEALVVLTSTGRVERRVLTQPERVVWSVPCDCRPGGRVAVGSDRAYVAQRPSARVAVLDLSSGVVTGAISPVPGADWPYDVATDSAHRLVTADLYGKVIQTWLATGTELAALRSGYAVGPRRLGLDAAAEGRLGAAGLFDGFVEVYDVAAGMLLSRWLPVVHAGPRPLADLAVRPDGRVMVADAAQRAIHVFAPRTGVLPTPDPGARPTPSTHSCRVTGDKVAAPGRVVLGSTARVTLTLAADCPPQAREVGADIVVVHETSDLAAHRAVRPDPGAMPAIREMFGLLAEPNSGRRFGFVETRNFNLPCILSQSLLLPLTEDMTALDRILAQHTDRSHWNDPDLTCALRTAVQHLGDAARPDALQALIIVTGGFFEDGGVAERAAREAREAGIQTFVLGVTSPTNYQYEPRRDFLTAVAGSPERYFHWPRARTGAQGGDIALSIGLQLRHWVNTSLPGNLFIDDELGPDVEYVADSAVPEVALFGRRLRWARTSLPGTGIALSYEVRPQRVGLLPTNAWARAEYTDIDGQTRVFEFPVPEIEVVAPTPTPTPTASPTPVPAYLPWLGRPAPPKPAPSYIPVALNERPCIPELERADVALVMDASTSMLSVDAAGRTRMQQAVSAAETLVGLLAPGDQTAVVWFNAVAYVEQGLTPDKAQVSAALQRITNAPSTRLDLGIGVAHAELLGPRRGPGHASVMVVLTDGRANPVPVDVAVAEAAVSKAAGIVIYTIGLGRPEELDVEALRAIASGPEHAYVTVDAAALAEIYTRIARAIPCPSDRYWGRR